MVDPSKNWISLNRALMSCDVWMGETFTRGQAWVDLLMMANYKEGFIRRRGIKIIVNRGQVGKSQDELALRWRWSKGKVQRFLKELKDDGRISNETVLKNIAISALITITNYDLYQTNNTEDRPENDTENGSVNEPKTDLKTVPKTGLEQQGKEGQQGEQDFSLSPDGPADTLPRIPYEQIRMAYNKFCPSFSKAVELNDARRNSIRLRWAKYKDHSGGPLAVFDTLFKKAEASDWLTGRDGKKTGGKFGFDWLLNAANMVKVLEGNYDNGNGRQGTFGSAEKPRAKAGGFGSQIDDSPKPVGFFAGDLKDKSDQW